MCPEGDVLMEKAGIDQVKKLADIIALTKDECNSRVGRLIFCSTLFRGFQTAKIIGLFGEKIVVLSQLCDGSEVSHETVDRWFEEIKTTAKLLKKEIVVVVCHGYVSTIFTEFVSEKINGVSIRNTLPPLPAYANGYSVDMKTGKVTNIVNA